MNKSILMVALASIIFPILAADQDCFRENSCNETTNVLTEMVAGTLIGAGSGVLCAFVDHKIPYIQPLTWLASMCLRNAVVNDCSKNMQTKGSVMSWFSFFATWLAYIKARQVTEPSYLLNARIIGELLFP